MEAELQLFRGLDKRPDELLKNLLKNNKIKRNNLSTY